MEETNGLVLHEWTVTKSWGESEYRLIKFEYEDHPNQIAVQSKGADGWYELEAFSEKRVMYEVLNHLASQIPTTEEENNE